MKISFDKFTKALLLVLSTSIAVAANEPKNMTLEISTLGIRFGKEFMGINAFARANANLSKVSTSTSYSIDDSITSNSSTSRTYSNMEIGIGFDKMYNFEKSKIGIRAESAYLFPYHKIYPAGSKYYNIISANSRLAAIASTHIGSFSFGGSFGPAATWSYQNIIYKSSNSDGSISKSNRKINRIDISIIPELFVQYNF